MGIIKIYKATKHGRKWRFFDVRWFVMRQFGGTNWMIWMILKEGTLWGIRFSRMCCQCWLPFFDFQALIIVFWCVLQLFERVSILCFPLFVVEVSSFLSWEYQVFFYYWPMWTSTTTDQWRWRLSPGPRRVCGLATTAPPTVIGDLPFSWDVNRSCWVFFNRWTKKTGLMNLPT